MMLHDATCYMLYMLHACNILHDDATCYATPTHCCIYIPHGPRHHPAPVYYYTSTCCTLHDTPHTADTGYATPTPHTEYYMMLYTVHS